MVVRRHRGSVDHLVILTADLDSAVSVFTLLGFSVSERGWHPSFQTENHLIVLDANYIELLAIRTEAEANRIFRERILVGRGLDGLALPSLDLDASIAAARRLGVPTANPQSFFRPVPAEGRDGKARFRAAVVETFGSMEAMVFFCEHRTPQFIWDPRLLRHSNGCTQIHSVTLPAVAPRRAGRILGVLTGASFTLADRGTVRLEGAPVIVLSTATPPRIVLTVRALPSVAWLRSSGLTVEDDASSLAIRHPSFGTTIVELRLAPMETRLNEEQIG